jgi:hypothetical protein
VEHRGAKVPKSQVVTKISVEFSRFHNFACQKSEEAAFGIESSKLSIPQKLELMQAVK